jgi:polysaccharide export outer membrane protein
MTSRTNIVELPHYRIATLLFLLAFVASCTTTKNIRYFKDISDSIQNTSYSVSTTKYIEPTIKTNDVLQISIQTIDPQANTLIGSSVTSMLNPNNVSNTSSVGLSGLPTVYNGYLVNRDGFIELPLVGKIKVSGLTTSEAQTVLSRKAESYYKDPVVNIRYLNFLVTILGDVARPGTYPVPNEKISILDAIGMAGDLTIFGKRQNVLLIREEDGKKTMVRFDLTSSKIFQSPYYYLRQGDIIYVEPNKAKAASNDQAQIRNLTITSTIITSISLIISRINF